jgi:hypothetical protein
MIDFAEFSTSRDVESLVLEFKQATPFPHIVMDSLWDTSQMLEIAAEFPPAEDSRWRTYPDPKEFGKRCGGSEMFGNSTRAWFDHVMGSPFINAMLKSMSGCDDLTPDLIGGGLHMSGERARLDMHVDFNIHPGNPNLERKINFLVFLNKNWDDDNGGVLYLGKDRQVSVSPQFNRTVIFECSNHSWHGHPEPIIGANFRKSLALYFYAPRSADVMQSHSTIWG